MLDEFLTLTSDMLRDERDRVSEDQLARAVALAVSQYSKDRPHRNVLDVTLTQPSRLDYPESGAVTAVEYPIGSIPPRYIPSQNFQRYDAPDGAELLFTRAVPAGASVRLTIAAPHTLDIDGTTIPDRDREALTSYAAAILFDQIAAETSGDGTPTIAGDAVNHASKPENYAKRAERLRQRYYDLLGLDPKRTVAASVTVSAPLPASDGGGRVTQGRRR